MAGSPDMRDPPEESVFCFLDGTRPCGPECVAYLVMKPTGDDAYKDPNAKWTNCHLLVNVHRGGKHIVTIAASMKKPTSPTPTPVTQMPPPVVK